MACEIHLNDIGTIFRLTLKDCDNVAIDISSATTKQIIYKKPDGTQVTKTADFHTDGTDGVIEYATQSGDLDSTGNWKIQAKVVLPTGTWSSNIQSFKVYANI